MPGRYYGLEKSTLLPEKDTYVVYLAVFFRKCRKRDVHRVCCVLNLFREPRAVAVVEMMK